MKKTAIVTTVFVAALMLATAGFAGQNNYGCGLGSMVFENNDSVVSQTLAATTNGTFASQLFGITSGTSNCEKPESFVYNEKVKVFVADNMDNLAADMARGSGEYLDTLATLMDVPQADRASLYNTLQANFSSIYTSDQVSSTDVLRNMDSVL
ncbi:MAG: DUF3015 domain-containing protein [Proteobacteria bacterium]|nr:DUF3015 domain-containing protein [Pseudomonadota bacterium]